jgi:hypothetical protein
MAKPLNIKPVQIYPSPELYDAIKETVDAGTYRSMNAAVIALVEIALGLGSVKVINNQNPVDIDTVKQLIKNELPDLKQQILDELSILIANSGSKEIKSTELSLEQKERVLNEVKNAANDSSQSWDTYTRAELSIMEEDEVKKIYRKAVPSIERQKGSPLHADKISKVRMIEMILERSPL